MFFKFRWISSNKYTKAFWKCPDSICLLEHLQGKEWEKTMGAFYQDLKPVFIHISRQWKASYREYICKNTKEGDKFPLVKTLCYFYNEIVVDWNSYVTP